MRERMNERACLLMAEPQKSSACDYECTGRYEETEGVIRKVSRQIQVTGNPTYKEGGFAFRAHGPFNGFDDECYRKPKPYE